MPTLFLRILKSILSANTGSTPRQRVELAREICEKIEEKLEGPVDAAIETFLHAAIRNPYLLGIANAGADDIIEWAVREAREHIPELLGVDEKTLEEMRD